VIFTPRRSVKNPGKALRAVPVKREQHATQHRIVITVEARAERGQQLILSARRVLLTPRRYSSTRTVKVSGLIITESHALDVMSAAIC